VYTATTSTDASPRAQGLSRDLAALIRERRAQDAGLGLPDAIVALELTREALLAESGVALAARRGVLAVALALAILVAGFAFFAMSQ
jgi:thiazole synthase ThiGH ThiG subunit